ncbi:uncharacterized protein GGS25DRAFT_516877 [Hypoxylon fragiforme]|uniref:uncharacterized protein n=1 Tax=Hypoxylon fragiforme TaxID=63214 RepID=UPI0020C6BD1D|nr:uncharacterized protein GGS25DRAFT_516877 [Hypoxylon fragiforme]KAI2614022.1 hypothetical protein GGS25DRAFT_516877 [Hypoxylon fragiforme]
MDRLPEEVLQIIFSTFLPDVDVCLIRHGPCIARPLLYHTIYAFYNTTRWLLIRTLIENPALGQHTRTIVISHEPEMMLRPHAKIHPDMLRHAVMKAQGRPGYPSRLMSKFLCCIEKGTVDSAESTFPLAFLPNLDQMFLYLPGDYFNAINIFSIITREIASSRDEARSSEGIPPAQLISASHFSKLRKIRVGCTMVGLLAKYNEFTAQLVKLPNLRSFASYQNTWSEEALRRAPGTIGIHNLILGNPRMTGEDLLYLLSKCPNLRGLKITFGYCERYIDRPYLPAIGDMLRNGPFNLETLILETSKMSAGREIDTKHILGSLRPLQKLTKLHLPLDILAGLRACAYDDSVEGEHQRYSLNIDQQLPHSLEIVDFEVFSLGHNRTNVYIHNQVMNLISNEYRINLRAVQVGNEINTVSVEYIRNVGRPGWSVICRNTSSEFNLENLLDNWPIISQGLVDISYTAPDLDIPRSHVGWLVDIRHDC